MNPHLGLTATHAKRQCTIMQSPMQGSNGPIETRMQGTWETKGTARFRAGTRVLMPRVHMAVMQESMESKKKGIKCVAASLADQTSSSPPELAPLTILTCSRTIQT